MESESRAPQHDAEGSEAEWDEQGREDRGEGSRERGPENHQHEDQPDMVGLPDRPDRPVDQPSRPLPAVARARTRPKVTQIPLAPVTASSVRITSYTVPPRTGL